MRPIDFYGEPLKTTCSTTLNVKRLDASNSSIEKTLRQCNVIKSPSVDKNFHFNYIINVSRKKGRNFVNLILKKFFIRNLGSKISRNSECIEIANHMDSKIFENATFFS